ncbi:hypothetical protein L210DRAFT_3527420, partial [Boletus edulis BED1]
MQNEIDQMLEDARRLLADPILNFSVLFPDDLLADSSRSGPSSLEDYDGSYSGDEEDDTEQGDGLGIDNVCEELGMYVPARLLSPIPEESLADELVVEEDAHSPPQSFKHAICFEERQWVAEKVRIMTKSSAEPPIPPRPPDVYLRQRRRRWKPPNPSLIANKYNIYRKLNKIDQRRPWSQTLKSRNLQEQERDTFLATFDL